MSKIVITVPKCHYRVFEPAESFMPCMVGDTLECELEGVDAEQLADKIRLHILGVIKMDIENRVLDAQKLSTTLETLGDVLTPRDVRSRS